MSPIAIELLIHCHTHPEPHPKIGSSDVYKSAKSFLLDAGLIMPYSQNGEHTDGVYITTEGGKIMVNELCNVHPPVQKWVFPKK